jgi:hypothetical protein
MATLIKTLDDVKKYVSVNTNTAFESIEPYIKQADRKYIKNLIGDTLYDAYATTAPTGIPLKVYDLLCEASANLAQFLYLPLQQVQVSDTGISVAQGESYKAAEWWQIRDLSRSFLEAGLQALDEALKIMEANEASFTGWSATAGYTTFKEFFVKRTDTFNEWFNISNSRRTFLALRPCLRDAHHNYFTSQLNEETIVTINLAVEPAHKKVLEFLQASQVNYAVAKMVDSGAFEITATGIFQKADEYPGYKTKTLEQFQLKALKDERLSAGEEYFKKALAIIEANPTLFTAYEKKTDATFVAPYNTKSTVSF